MNISLWYIDITCRCTLHVWTCIEINYIFLIEDYILFFIYIFLFLLPYYTRKYRPYLRNTPFTIFLILSSITELALWSLWLLWLNLDVLGLISLIFISMILVIVGLLCILIIWIILVGYLVRVRTWRKLIWDYWLSECIDWNVFTLQIYAVHNY